MAYAGKPLPQILADGERRKAEQAARELLHVQRMGRSLRRVNAWCTALGSVGLLFAAAACGLRWWLWPLLVLLAHLGPRLIIACGWGVLRGMVAGGLVIGLPGMLIILFASSLTAGAGAAGQVILLVFGALGGPLIAGALCGLLRERIDEDHLQI